MARGEFFREKKKPKGKNKKIAVTGMSNTVGAPTFILPKVIGRNKKEQ